MYTFLEAGSSWDSAHIYAFLGLDGTLQSTGGVNEPKGVACSSTHAFLFSPVNNTMYKVDDTGSVVQEQSIETASLDFQSRLTQDSNNVYAFMWESNYTRAYLIRVSKSDITNYETLRIDGSASQLETRYGGGINTSDGVYIASDDNDLTAYSLSDGTTVWEAADDTGAIMTAHVMDGSHVYSITESGTLYQIEHAAGGNRYVTDTPPWSDDWVRQIDSLPTNTSDWIFHSGVRVLTGNATQSYVIDSEAGDYVADAGDSAYVYISGSSVDTNN